jgi:alpha-N-arabinofuranosidase
VSEEALGPYVQDALHVLEFIMGDATTEYGALRASLGYPTPWDLKYIEVGNEDNLSGGLETYVDYRFEMFFNAIRSAYPNVTIIASTLNAGAAISDSAGDFHLYTRPDTFVKSFGQFDQRTSEHLVLVGEYATFQPNNATDPDIDWNAARKPWPFWIGSVSEAIFALGIERNGEKMIGASYAPLLQNRNVHSWAVCS